MPTPKLRSLAIFTLLTILIMPGSVYAQYFGARYVSEQKSIGTEYYCLRTEDGKIYQRLGDWVQKTKEKTTQWTLPIDSMVQFKIYDLAESKSLQLHYMFGSSNHVGIFEDSIRRYFNGIDSTEIQQISSDSLEILRLSEAESPYFGRIPRHPIRQHVVLGDTTLPAIHPINIEYPEIKHLPVAISNGKHTWYLEEVFYDRERIDNLLSIIYRDDFHPFTEADMDQMIQSFGMTKQEWWAYIQKEAEKKQYKK
jgi:hypothetical protein